MRTCVALLTCLLSTAVAQDAPDAQPTMFSFSVEQGWSFASESEGDFPDIQENDLQEGLNPPFRPPITLPTFPTRDRDNRPRPRGHGVRVVRTSRDPLKLEGSILLLPEGACQPQFKRIEYWDRTQRYWIDFQNDKVRTHELGGLEKWSGSRAEWPARQEKLEAAFRSAYLKAVTPQKPAPASDHLGLEGSAGTEPAGRLFVTTSLEEQLAVLLLARMDGAVIERTKWPEGSSGFPERSVFLARAILDRILAQAKGTFAPGAARVRPGRTLKDEVWQGTEIAIPSLGWIDGRAWVTERLRPVEQARGRLRALADEPNRKGFTRFAYMDPDSWRAAVEEEAKQLRRKLPVNVPDRPGTLEDSLLPRTRGSGLPTYDFREKSDVREGHVHSSDADVHGFVPDLEVFFFHSGQNVWRTSLIRLETWYKGNVKRE